MTNWAKKIKIKDLFTVKEDWQSVQDSMNRTADVLSSHWEFKSKGLIQKMRNIPKGDEYFKPLDYANKLISTVYDIADEEKIWID